jgi:hypothetical protein
VNERRYLPTAAVLLAVALPIVACGRGGSGGGGGNANVGSSSSPAPTDSSTSAPPGTRNPAATTPTSTISGGRKVTWENVTFVIPAAWKDNASRGGFAAGPRIYDYKGYALGRLNAVSGFDGKIDELAPKACLRTDATSRPETPSGVVLVESGFAPIGDRTAEYRRWTATCTSGVEEHRAWVLPVSRIAVYEVCHDNDTVAVASSALVTDSATAQQHFGAPYPNELGGSCRNDLPDSATGT